MDPGQSKLMEVIQHLIEALEALAERVDRMDARLRVVERPSCQHQWKGWCIENTPDHPTRITMKVRECTKCGRKEYMP